MSITKQILLSVVVLIIAGGAWYAWNQNLIPFLPHTAPAASGGGFGGGPGGFAGGPGGFGGGPGGPGGAPGGAANARAPAPIVAAAVTLDDDGYEVKAIGTVAASKAITVYPQISGIVAEVSFTPGTEVKSGQPLVHLVNSDEQVALQKAKVGLDSAQAAFDRTQQLAKANTVTAAALSDSQTSLTNAQIAYQTAQLALDKKTVIAPFTGVTGLGDVTTGDFVTSSKAITTLDDLSTVEVAFDVPERASGRVAVGQEVTATTQALSGKTFTGKITAVDSRVDPTARTLKVEASLPNEANSLKPGMAVTITMEFPGEMHPVVPSLAIQYDRNGGYVWKVEKSVVHRVGVNVLDRRSGTVIVDAALNPGDLVASEGLQRLRENARVNVVDDGSGGPPATPAAPVASAAPEPAATPPAVTGAPTGGNRPQGAGGGFGGQGGTGGQGGAARANGGPNGFANRQGGAGGSPPPSAGAPTENAAATASPPTLTPAVSQ